MSKYRQPGNLELWRRLSYSRDKAARDKSEREVVVLTPTHGGGSVSGFLLLPRIEETITGGDLIFRKNHSRSMKELRTSCCGQIFTGTEEEQLPSGGGFVRVVLFIVSISF